jgi:hypothetical protein
LLDQQVFARVKAALSRLWAEIKQSEVYKEYLVWLHNAGKALPADAGWLFGFSPSELDAYRFVIANGLYTEGSSWAVAWVSENRHAVMELRLEIKDGFTRQQLAAFSSRTRTKSLGYHLHCVKRFVTTKLTEGASMLAAQALRVQTPELIEKYAAGRCLTVDYVKEKIAKYKNLFPEETDLTILYNYAAGSAKSMERGIAPVPLWRAIHKLATQIVNSTGKPIGVVQAAQNVYLSMVGAH